MLTKIGTLAIDLNNVLLVESHGRITMKGGITIEIGMTNAKAIIEFLQSYIDKPIEFQHGVTFVAKCDPPSAI